MKILHTSDWHVRDKDIEECEKCLSFLVDTAKTEGVDLTAIAGDIFDSQDVKLDSKAAKLVVKTVSELADIAPVVIVIGTPSHDGTAPAILQYARGKHDKMVSCFPEQFYLSEDGYLYRTWRTGAPAPKAIISMIPQPTKQYWQSQAGISGTDLEIGQALSGLFAGFGARAANYPGVPHILVYHGGISGARLPSGQVRTGMDIEVSTDQMMLSNPDLMCCGHIHQNQQIGDRCFYSGPIYSTKIDEQDAGCYIHNTDPNDFLNEEAHCYVETPHKRTVRITDKFSVGGGGEPRDIDLQALAGAYVRHEITVWQDEAETIDKENIRQHYFALGAIDVDIRIIRLPRENVRAEAVLKADSLVDKLVAMAGLRGETLSPAILEKARMLETMTADEILQGVQG
jgi:DNA repair exonuclease SbcCD nuclease subunit